MPKVPDLGLLYDAVRSLEEAGKARGKLRPTVEKPTEILYPDIYRDPLITVGEAASRIPPESPLLQELFGVTRRDLDEGIAAIVAREGLAQEPRYRPARGKPPEYLDRVMTPANERRLRDGAEAAREYIPGAYGWFNLDPLRSRYMDERGAEAGADAFRLFTELGSAVSAKSTTPMEVRRASLAQQMINEGRGADFADPSNLPAGYGHLSHRGAHAPRVMAIVRDGTMFPNDAAHFTAQKYSGYTANKQGRLGSIAADSHLMRQSGVSDVRPVPSKVKKDDPRGGSAKPNEYAPFEDWFRERVAGPIGQAPAGSQSGLWVGMGPATGLLSPPVPYLEVIANAAGQESKRTGVSAEKALRRFLRGEGRLYSSAPIGAGLLLSGGEQGSD